PRSLPRRIRHGYSSRLRLTASRGQSKFTQRTQRQEENFERPEITGGRNERACIENQIRRPRTTGLRGRAATTRTHSGSLKKIKKRHRAAQKGRCARFPSVRTCGWSPLACRDDPFSPGSPIKS